MYSERLVFIVGSTFVVSQVAGESGARSSMNSAADRWRLITGADKTIPGRRSVTAYQLTGENTPSLTVTRHSSRGNDVVKYKLEIAEHTTIIQI